MIFLYPCFPLKIYLVRICISKAKCRPFALQIHYNFNTLVIKKFVDKQSVEFLKKIVTLHWY